MRTLATVAGTALAFGEAVRLDGHARAWIDTQAGVGPMKGPIALVEHIEHQLARRGYASDTIDDLLGQNLLRHASTSSAGATG